MDIARTQIHTVTKGGHLAERAIELPTRNTSGTVGYLGLGKVGQIMVGQLVSMGSSVAAWNRSQKNLSYSEDLFQQLGSAAQVILQCPVTIMCLADGNACFNVLESVPESLGHEVSERIIINLTTLHPDEACALSKLAEKRGIAYVDGAFTGGIPSVQNRSSFFIVSCNGVLMEKVCGILSQLGKEVLYVGDTPGLAQKYKAANQTVSAIHHYAACVTVALAKKYGYDPHVIYDLMQADQSNDLNGATWVTKHKLGAIVDEKFEGHHSVDNFYKDIGIARNLLNRGMMQHGEFIERALHLRMWDKYLRQAQKALFLARLTGHGKDASHIMGRFAFLDVRTKHFTKWCIQNKRVPLQQPQQHHLDDTLLIIYNTLFRVVLDAAFGINDIARLLGISSDGVYFMLKSGSGRSEFMDQRFFKRPL